MAEEGSGATVSFEFLFNNLQKSLESGFNRLDRSVDEVRKQLEQKASLEQLAGVKREVAELELRHEQRLSSQDKEIGVLKDAALSDAGVSEFKGKWVNWLGALAVVIVGYLFYLAATGGFH